MSETTMTKILWVDLEMTGLDVEKEVIIEVAAIITDLNFTHLETYHAIVQQPQHYLDNMDEWNTEHHTRSGLVAQIPNGKTPEVVETELCNLVKKHFTNNEKAILAGNSIGQDRTFIKKYFQQLEGLLHYRMLDVSSWKLIFKNIYNCSYDKEPVHRALDDIEESIAELKHYMTMINIDSGPA